MTVMPGRPPPQGLTINSSGELTGQIYGDGMYTFTITVTDADVPDLKPCPKTFTLTVNPAPVY